MNKRNLVVLALLACLTGCVPVDSLNPLYTDKDLIYDESLLGYWVGSDNGKDGGLEISKPPFKDDKRTYMLTMFDKSRNSGKETATVYLAYLVNLRGNRFFDVMQEQWDAHSDAYSLQIQSGKAGTRVEPRFLKLSSGSYLEFGEGAPGDGGKVHANLRRAHWIMRVTGESNKLKIDWADDDEFRKAVQSGSLHLSNSLLGSGKNKDVVITASTQELQKFVLEHADDNTFFNSKTSELHRKEQ